MIGSIACIISLVILYLTIKLCKNSQKSISFNYIDFEKNIDEIINSRFSTVLERSVPKGEGDSNLGLDYIPFLLENTGRRKRKFKKRADKLLILFTVLGAIFALVIITYGYIVIDSSFVKDDADTIKYMQEYLGDNEEVRDIIQNDKGIKKFIDDFKSQMKNKDTSLEVIKIISIGLMLAGFFIGILKYFFNIYISNFNQMLMADKEEMQIRKYYVAYKGSKTDEERKAAVLRFLEPTISQENNGH
ncbi:MAG TPA: hypothetical protein VIO64_21940 [Pseudobacteroides sp.]|uniref:hypothetical protein n=1 Tax=Pseudobacteroides sp. TaxID=1968840 RepID=UPI002F91EF8D